MSETNTAAMTVTDANGRVLVLRELDPADTMDLMEAAGGTAENGAWFRMAIVIASVESIDGIPLPQATKKDHIRANARQIGNIGLMAVTRHLFPDMSGDGASKQDEEKAVAKN